MDIGDDVGGALFVLWLEQRLSLATEAGLADAQALDRARALLAGKRVPVLLVERLQRAVDAAPAQPV